MDFNKYDHNTSFLRGEYQFHWSLVDDQLHAGIKGKSDTFGWVGFGISGEIHQMIGSEAVIGWFNETSSVHSYRLERKSVEFIINNDENIPLSNTSACIEKIDDSQYTIVHFIRNINDGMNKINVGENEVTNIVVAIGPRPELSYHLTRRSQETIILNPKDIIPEPEKPPTDIIPEPEIPPTDIIPEPENPPTNIIPEPSDRLPSQDNEEPAFAEPSYHSKLSFNMEIIIGLILVSLLMLD